jgi:ornithine carbamoyltransferase
MPINLRGRSILTLGELSSDEIRFLLRLAAEFKAARLVSRGPGSRARTLP